MNPWDTYTARMGQRGMTRRSAALTREARFLTNKLADSLSYHSVLVNGVEQNLAVINSDNLNKKTLCTLPGEDVPHGSTVKWMDNYWLVIERDANNEIYTKAVMQQCNYMIRWIDADDESIVERWCIIEDGTKYLTGEYGDNHYVIVRGDSRVSMILPKDEYTIRLNRESRFLIDDYDSPNVLAYRLTKPFKIGGTFNGNGVLSFVLTECNTEDTDNFELHIANYYDHFPRPTNEVEEPELPGGGDQEIDPPSQEEQPPGQEEPIKKKVWL